MCPHSSQRNHSPASQVHRRIVGTGSVSRLPHRVHDSSGGDIAGAFPKGEEGVELKLSAATTSRMRFDSALDSAPSPSRPPLDRATAVQSPTI